MFRTVDGVINSVVDENEDAVTPIEGEGPEGLIDAYVYTLDGEPQTPGYEKRLLYVLHPGCVIDGDRQNNLTIIKKDGTVEETQWSLQNHTYTVTEDDYLILCASL